MTLRELETYIALEIVGAYHARIHKALDLPPAAAWNRRISGTMVRKPSDPRQFLTDFLPCEERTATRRAASVSYPLLVRRAALADGARPATADHQIRPA